MAKNKAVLEGEQVTPEPAEAAWEPGDVETEAAEVAEAGVADDCTKVECLKNGLFLGVGSKMKTGEVRDVPAELASDLIARGLVRIA